MSYLYILEINPLSVSPFANVFSHSEHCLFVVFMVSFAVQKLLSLFRSICLFLFSLGHGSKNILPQFMSKSVLPEFSSMSFIVSGMNLTSKKHFLGSEVSSSLQETFKQKLGDWGDVAGGSPSLGGAGLCFCPVFSVCTFCRSGNDVWSGEGTWSIVQKVCRKASEDQVDENDMGPEPMGRCPMVLGSKMRAGQRGPGHPRRSTMPQRCWGGEWQPVHPRSPGVCL